jgi:hypothetical protein
MRYLTTVSLLLVSFSSALALNNMTHEEQTVRATYGKLAFAARAGVLLHYALDARVGNNLLDPSALKKELDSQLAFQFEAVNVGNLADIANLRSGTLITKPQLDLISVAFAYDKQPMKIGREEPSSSLSYVFATWQRWDDHEWNGNAPVSQILDDLAKSDLSKDTLKPSVVYSRYAAYTVTATLGGRQRTYQAIFLFGKNPDGSEAVYPIDHILGMGVLNMITDRSIYPQPLLETYMRELPEVAKWISSAVLRSKSSLPEVVCDGTSGSLGVISNDTQLFSCTDLGPPGSYNTQERLVQYQVLDTSSQPVPIQVLDMSATESLAIVTNTCGVEDLNPTAGALTGSNGYFPGPDTLRLCSAVCLPANGNGNPTGSCNLNIAQTWTVNGYPVKSGTLGSTCPGPPTGAP